MNARQGWQRLWRAMRDTLLPPRCAACGDLFEPAVCRDAQSAPEVLTAAGFARLMAPFLCRRCREGFQPVLGPLCPVCGQLYADRQACDHLCAGCLTQPDPITQARAVGLHCGPLPAVVHSLKYRGRLQLAGPLGVLLREAFLRHWQRDEIDAVLPVPLHPRRMRQRGFNQAYLALRRAWQGPPLPPVRRDWLLRCRATSTQTGLDRAARRENTRGAFRVPLPRSVAGLALLLVDDVRTTGSTAAACAEALLAAGARRVDLLTVSRVQH